MDLIQWRPGRELGPWRRLRDIEDEMDTLLGRVFGRESLQQGGRVWAPVVDVKQTKTEVTVKAELPEFKAEDVDITVEGSTLTIKGERKSEEKKEDEGYLYSERSWGSFIRTIALPGEVDEAKTRASYKEGVLTVVMPKKKQEKAKQIKVDVK